MRLSIFLLSLMISATAFGQRKHKGECFCPAEHANSGNWYLNLQTGPVWNAYNNGKYFSTLMGARIGSNFSPSFSLQAGADYFAVNDIAMEYPYRDMATQNLSVPLELIYRLPMGNGKFVPYVLGGAAANFIQTERTLLDSEEIIEDNGFRLGSAQWRAGGGINYILTEKTSAFVQGVYTQSFLKENFTAIGKSTGVNAGITFHF